MGTFLARHKLPKPTREEVDNMNSPMAIKEIKLVDKNISTRKLHV